MFDWGRKRTEVQTKEDAVTQAALELKDTEERVRAEVAHNYRRIIEARKELELAQEPSPPTRRLFEWSAIGMRSKKPC